MTSRTGRDVVTYIPALGFDTSYLPRDFWDYNPAWDVNPNELLDKVDEKCYNEANGNDEKESA